MSEHNVTVEHFDIHLKDFSPAGAKVLSSRPWGISARYCSDIDRLIDENKNITIHISKDISGINPSFLEEFLENVFHKLGWKTFKERINFEYENGGYYKIDSDLKVAAGRVLTKQAMIA